MHDRRGIVFCQERIARVLEEKVSIDALDGMHADLALSIEIMDCCSLTVSSTCPLPFPAQQKKSRQQKSQAFATISE